jgi:hypothetical protein
LAILADLLWFEMVERHDAVARVEAVRRWQFLAGHVPGGGIPPPPVFHADVDIFQMALEWGTMMLSCLLQPPRM